MKPQFGVGQRGEAETSSDDSGEIKFGDGIRGSRPSSGATDQEPDSSENDSVESEASNPSPEEKKTKTNNDLNLKGKKILQN